MPGGTDAAACSDGRFSDAERAGIADQSGEARLLGGAARARRDDTATASFGSRVAQGRSRDGSALARRAGAAPGEPGVCLVPCALRYVRSGLRGLRSRGRAPQKRIWPDGAWKPMPFARRVTGHRNAGIQEYIRQKRQDDYLDNFCRKLLSYALGRTLILSDEPLLDSMRSRLGERISLQRSGGRHRHQSAVSQPPNRCSPKEREKGSIPCHA